MANPPHGGQDPQLPSYPQGPVGPVATAQPARPPAMQRAVSLTYAGAALGLVAEIVSSLTTHNMSFYAYNSTSGTTHVHSASSIVAGIIGGLIVAGLWLWMAWKTGAGRSWARVLSSVFFGFMCLGLIGGLVGLAGGTVLAFVFTLAEWGVGLAAIIYLWKRESNEFFASAKQAKLAGAYGGAYAGYQPYGQQPQYGQPGYGQPGYGQQSSGQEPPPPPRNG
jgi:hypothetical protein